MGESATLEERLEKVEAALGSLEKRTDQALPHGLPKEKTLGFTEEGKALFNKVVERTRKALGVREKAEGAWEHRCYAFFKIAQEANPDETEARQITLAEIAIYTEQIGDSK